MITAIGFLITGIQIIPTAIGTANEADIRQAFIPVTGAMIMVPSTKLKPSTRGTRDQKTDMNSIRRGAKPMSTSSIRKTRLSNLPSDLLVEVTQSSALPVEEAMPSSDQPEVVSQPSALSSHQQNLHSALSNQLSDLRQNQPSDLRQNQSSDLPVAVVESKPSDLPVEVVKNQPSDQLEEVEKEVRGKKSSRPHADAVEPAPTRNK
jgi:hypothetical protein